MAAVASPGRHLIELLEDPRQFAAEMPAPVSQTSTLTWVAVLRATTTTPPCAVYLMAFCTRLPMMRSSSCGSLVTDLPPVEKRRPRPDSSACPAYCICSRRNRSRSGKVCISGVALLPSSREMSSMELNERSRSSTARRKLRTRGSSGVCCRRFCSVAANRARVHAPAGAGRGWRWPRSGSFPDRCARRRRARPPASGPGHPAPAGGAVRGQSCGAAPRPCRGRSGCQHAGESPARHGDLLRKPLRQPQRPKAARG
jgi:hypothetical protein